MYTTGLNTQKTGREKKGKREKILLRMRRAMYSAKREGERSGRAAFTLNGTIVRERSIMWTTTTGKKKSNKKRRNEKK